MTMPCRCKLTEGGTSIAANRDRQGIAKPIFILRGARDGNSGSDNISENPQEWPDKQGEPGI